MRSITSEDHIQHVRERGGADFGFAFGDMARFRVSVFKEKGNFGMVLRQIPNKLLTLEQIGMPPSAKELLYKPRGLVLVTGPTGSGKTTTLASMINIINEERDEAHIITIEDPIEYYHKHKKALVTQREIGVDVPNFAEALRRALAPGPGRDPGRRNARPGNDRRGHHRGGNGPLGVRHAAHHRRGQDHRPYRQRLPDQPAGADPHSAFDGAAGGDLAVADPAHRQARPRGGLRDHDQHAVHRGADPRQQDLPHQVGHPDRRQVRHGDAGQLPDGEVPGRA